MTPKQLGYYEDILDLPAKDLSDWELDFLSSLTRRLDQYGELDALFTEKQLGKLESIWLDTRWGIPSRPESKGQS